MDSDLFFAAHPVFTLGEFAQAGDSGARAVSTAKTLLARQVDAGRIVRVRRGLYATVPPGVEPARAAVDPFLLASRLADDAVVAYHAALQFRGKAYSIWRRFHYVTSRPSRPLSFSGGEFVPVAVPAALRLDPGHEPEVEAVPHAGSMVRVTSLERTLVDVLGSPSRSGGWEEVWRSLEMVEFFDVDRVVEYAHRLGSAVTAARVGVFLQQHQKELMVDEQGLIALRAMRPRQPRYFDPERRRGRMLRDWNLIVPDDILERRWEEVA